jgi:SAM-dependent methyltransferase
VKHRRSSPTGNPFSLLSKNWLVWRIHRRHVRSVAHLVHGQVLDIGCGEQPLESCFADRPVDRIWGTDHIDTLHLDHKIDVFASAMSLPFRDRCFDGAICLQVLEHVPEPLDLLKEARRVLKPGTHLILTAPHIWNVHEAPHDYYRFTLYGLRHLFERAGLEVVEVRPMAGFFVTAAARLCYFLEHFDRWGLQIFVKPAYLVVQALGGLLDKIYCDTAETWNYLAVGRAPHES